MNLGWRSLMDAMGRLDPRRRAETETRLEKEREALFDEADAYEELLASEGWRLLKQRLEANIATLTEQVAMAPPAPSKHDPFGVLWRAQREWASAEAAGQRHVLELPRQIIARAESIDRLQDDLEEETDVRG